MIDDMSDVILFDIDNTLIDTKKLLNSYIKPALQEYLVSDVEHFEEVSSRYWQTLEKPTRFDPESILLTCQWLLKPNTQPSVTLCTPLVFLATAYLMIRKKP